MNPRKVEQVCDSAVIIEAQRLTSTITVVPEVIDYALRLTRHTREAHGMSLGAGTRGAISLVQVSKAYAIMAGRDYVIPDDIKEAALLSGSVSEYCHAVLSYLLGCSFGR